MTQIYQATSLHLADLAGAVVDVDDTLTPGTIGVQITGPAESAAAVQVRTEAGELYVSAPAGSGTTIITAGRGVNIVSGTANVGMVIGNVRGSMVQIGNGMVIAGGAGEVIVNGRRINLDDMPEAPAPARVHITVPADTPVTIADTAIGSYRIGSTRGALRVTGSSTTVQAGSVGSTRIRVQGTGDITIAEVTGHRLDLGVSGTGRVNVNGGQVDTMTARVSGTGHIDFGGTVNGDAELEVSGMGGISVHRVTGHADRYVSGMGRINVRNRG